MVKSNWFIIKLTNYTSVILGPNEDLTRIKKIDFVKINDHDGWLNCYWWSHVQSQTFKWFWGTQFKETITTLDELLRNRYLKDAKEILSRSFMKDDVIGYMEYQEKIVDAFIRAFTKMSEEDVYLAGLGNMITQSEIEDPEELRRLLYVLDQKDVLKVIGRTNKLTFKIGREAEFMPTDRCTIISVPYAVSDEEVGTIAIIGPTRMDYAKVIPLMEYIAKNITKLYKKWVIIWVKKKILKMLMKRF